MEWGAKARELSSIMQSGDQLKRKAERPWGNGGKSRGKIFGKGDSSESMTKVLPTNEVICMHDNCYCIFFGARANIEIDKMPQKPKTPLIN